jgi:type II secretory pathway pseudopilin PulG
MNVSLPILRRKLPAFTLVESLAAVAILTIAFSATFMTVGWVLSTNQMPLELQASAVLRNAAQETKNTKRFINETLEMNGFKIERKVQELSGHEGYFLIAFYALDEHARTITTYEEIVYAP